MKDHVLLTMDDVDFVRSTLLAAQIHLYANDQAESQRKMQAETTESPLTKEITECLQMVDDAAGQAMLAGHDAILDEEYDGD